MKIQKTLQLRMTKENYKRLERQANFIGTTRNNIILLKLYIHRYVRLKEDEISIALQEIKKNEETDTDIIVSDFPEFHQRIFKDKSLYLYSINEYASALFHVVFPKEHNYWKESDEKSDKMNRVYNIEEDILNRFVDFSKEIKISQKTLLNYAFMRDLHEQTTYNVSADKGSRKRKGLEFTIPSIQKLDEIDCREREHKINQLLAVIPTEI